MEFWLCAYTVFTKDFKEAYVGHLEKTLGFVVVSFLINPRPTPRIFVEFWLCAHGVFSKGLSRSVCWALGKTLGFVIASFLINPRPTLRILWNSAFAQVLCFLPKDFQDVYVGHLGKPYLL